MTVPSLLLGMLYLRLLQYSEQFLDNQHTFSGLNFHLGTKDVLPGWYLLYRSEKSALSISNTQSRMLVLGLARWLRTDFTILDPWFPSRPTKSAIFGSRFRNLRCCHLAPRKRIFCLRRHMQIRVDRGFYWRVEYVVNNQRLGEELATWGLITYPERPCRVMPYNIHGKIFESCTFRQNVDDHRIF